MDEKEFIEREIIPVYIEVMKKLFEKKPEICEMYRTIYEDELKRRGINIDKASDDPIFTFLMK